ncbi:hypothetical protein [Infirmifilum sp.]
MEIQNPSAEARGDGIDVQDYVLELLSLRPILQPGNLSKASRYLSQQ